MDKQTVAVIGAGPSGLAIAKNLLEVAPSAFDITIFEKKSGIGGVWAYTDDENITSTIRGTVSNVSKFGNSFTDFPISDDMPSHLTAEQACDYIKAYASHFSIEKYVRFNTSVKWIQRNAQDTKWQVCTQSENGEETKDFDKVAMCSGLTNVPITPDIEGSEKFKGRAVHVQGFKRPEDFKGQRVLVVGMGNSAADTSTQLIGHASKIYLSHRGGAKIVGRMHEGKPLDLVVTRQLNLTKFFLGKYLPALSRWSFDYVIEGVSKKCFPNMNPSWRLKPAPSLAHHQPVISDDLVSSLQEEKITSVHGIKSFIGEHSVELSDGTQLEIDAVIWCTGYEPDFSLFRDYDPYAPLSPTITDKQRPARDKMQLAHLYHNLFPPQYASSLVFFNYAALSDGAMTIIDVSTMALAQIWKPVNPYPLPPPSIMAQQISQHHAWVRSLTRGGKVTPYTGIVRPQPFYHFINEAAGTGVDDYLGLGAKGWGFWWRDRKMCKLMMNGVMTPFMYRYFDVPGREGRLRWEGAREAILHANELARGYGS